MSHKSLITRPWISVVPILMLLVFLFFYVAANRIFIECKTAKYLVQCEPIAAAQLLVPTDKSLSETEAKAKALQQALLGKQYSGRMIWMFFAAANILFGAFIMAMFFLVARYWLKSWTWAAALVLISLLGGAAVSYTDYLFLAGPLFKATIQSSDTTGITNFIDVSRFLNSLAYGLGLALVLVVASILFAKENGNDKSRSLGVLTRKSEHLRLVLYGSTIALVVGVLRMDQGFTWAMSFIPDVSVATTAEAFYRSVTMTIGGFFTLLLTAVFLPVSFIIYERAKTYVSDGTDESAVSAELEKSGFKFSLAAALPRMLAIASPLLTGPIADLLKNIGSTNPQ